MEGRGLARRIKNETKQNGVKMSKINTIKYLSIICAFSVSLTTVAGLDENNIAKDKLVRILDAGPLGENVGSFLPSLERYIAFVRKGEDSLDTSLLLRATKYAYFLGTGDIKNDAYELIEGYLKSISATDEESLYAISICSGNRELTGISSKKLEESRFEFEKKSLDYVDILMRGGDGTIAFEDASAEIEYILNIKFRSCEFRAKCTRIIYKLKFLNYSDHEYVEDNLNEILNTIKTEEDKCELNILIEYLSLYANIDSHAHGIDRDMLYTVKKFIEKVESAGSLIRSWVK